MRSLAIELSASYNAHAATFDDDRSAGFVNVWGNSFPAEEVPFGRAFELDGVEYRLPAKRAGNPDHVEALGQTIDLEREGSVDGMPLLGFGEMGAQPLDIEVIGPAGGHRWRTTLPGWLVTPHAPGGTQSWRASHLHYAA